MSDMGSILSSLTEQYKNAIAKQLEEKPLFLKAERSGKFPAWGSPFDYCPMLKSMVPPFQKVHVKPRPMTVSKLIHKLQQFPSNMLVYTQDSEYGSQEVSRIYKYEWLDNVVVLE